MKVDEDTLASLIFIYTRELKPEKALDVPSVAWAADKYKLLG